MAVNSETAMRENIEVTLHDADQLRQIEGWEDASVDERAMLARDTAVVDQWTVSNVTCADYHDHLVAVHDPEVPGGSLGATFSHLAIGNNATAPVVTNSSLNNEIYRTTVSEYNRQSRESSIIVFLDAESEVNGNNLYELGLVTGPTSGEWFLVNHALIDDPTGRLEPKTSAVAATFEVNIRYRDDSELP